MQFQVAERMMLLNLLSGAEGDVTMLRIVRDAQNALGFSEEDQEILGIGPPCAVCNLRKVEHPDESDHQFEPNRNQVAWKPNTSAEVKEVDLGRAAQKVISERLEFLSTQKKLALNQLALYEKFVEGEDIPTKESDNGQKAGQRVPNRAQRRARA